MICPCGPSGAASAAETLRTTGWLEVTVAGLLLLYIIYATYRRCMRRSTSHRCCPRRQTQFASIKDSFNDHDDDLDDPEIGDYHSDDDEEEEDDDDKESTDSSD